MPVEVGTTLTDRAAIIFDARLDSFVGLHTTYGVTQDLVFGANLPVMLVNSLVTCAEQTRAALPVGTIVTVALDAHTDECYWANFIPTNAMQGASG